MIFYLIYTSRPRTPMSNELLDEITTVSIKNNAKLGITGMLLGVENRYIQYLEGEEEKVQALYEKIKEDGRHYEINKWVQGLTKERVFSEWSMGSWMLTNEQLRTLPGLEELGKFLDNPTNRNSYASKFLDMMHGLLKTWIVHEPELVERQKSYGSI